MLISAPFINPNSLHVVGKGVASVGAFAQCNVTSTQTSYLVQFTGKPNITLRVIHYYIRRLCLHGERHLAANHRHLRPARAPNTLRVHHSCANGHHFNVGHVPDLARSWRTLAFSEYVLVLFGFRCPRWSLQSTSTALSAHQALTSFSFHVVHCRMYATESCFQGRPLPRRRCGSLAPIRPHLSWDQRHWCVYVCVGVCVCEYVC